MQFGDQVTIVNPSKDERVAPYVGRRGEILKSWTTLNLYLVACEGVPQPVFFYREHLEKRT